MGNKFTKPFIVKREDVPSINKMDIGKVEYDLGILKDFRKNTKINEFIDTNREVDISWTALEKDKILLPHRHPVNTMVIMCKGRAMLIGDSTAKAEEGDIICIPKGSLHGLKSYEDEGFWSISLVFSKLGVYNEEMTYF